MKRILSLLPTSNYVSYGLVVKAVLPAPEVVKHGSSSLHSGEGQA